jgi:flagellar hook-associated protein 2
MAVSSTSSSTSRAGSTLDVAGIVSGLMEAENVPVNKLDAKITKSAVKISALAQIKSQLSTLKASLIDLQTPANFTKQAAKLSSSSVATAEITAAATAASYQMEVTSLAQPAIWNVTGFSSEQNALNWYSLSPVAPQVDRSGFTPTVFKSADNLYVLSLQAKSSSALFGTSSGTTLTSGALSGLSTYGTNISFSRAQESLDAVFKLNGVEFTRSSNTVTDALTGITLNLTTKTTAPITLTVSNDPVSARPKVDAMVKAYNDLYALYKEQTASSIDLATRGVLNSDFGVSSMMRQLTSGLLLPLSNIEGVTLTGQNDLSAMGLKLLDGGTLAVDETLYASASSTLQTRLSAGIRIGYSDSTISDLSTQIGNMLISGGVIQDRIDSEKNMQSDLNNRKTSLQEKLIGVQARYTAQYASLDALLFKLQGTSDSLKSALDGLTNSQKNG